MAKRTDDGAGDSEPDGEDEIPSSGDDSRSPESGEVDARVTIEEIAAIYREMQPDADRDAVRSRVEYMFEQLLRDDLMFLAVDPLGKFWFGLTEKGREQSDKIMQDMLDPEDNDHGPEPAD